MGFRAADVPAQRGRPPEGTRIDGHRELLDRRAALQAAGGLREQAALSLLRNGRIESDIHRDANTLARARRTGPAQDAYDRARREKHPATVRAAKQARDSAAATEPRDVDVARALAKMLPPRAKRRPALTDKRALAAQAVEWEARRLRRFDERVRKDLIELRKNLRTTAADIARPPFLRDFRRSLLSGLFPRR